MPETQPTQWQLPADGLPLPESQYPGAQNPIFLPDHPFLALHL